MPADRDVSARRNVVPQAAGRSLWLAAVWTGVGAAVVCATAGIVAVAICWLPTAASSGHSMSAIRAGLLTFLASLHGGITVDGMSAMFVPLGMLLVVVLIAWRAGSALADVARELDERDPVRLAVAGAAQAASFMAACLLAVPFATLGTSRAPFLGVGIAALLLFGVAGGAALARSSALGEWCRRQLPGALRECLRPALAATTIYLGAGALLAAGSLILHHDRAEMLSGQVGGGLSGVPVLLLGILAAPNAAIAGASYLAGPGFAVGSGTTASALTTAHGTLPAFPILAAVPGGHGATPVGWLLIVLTVLGAGLVVARMSTRAGSRRAQLRVCACAAPAAGLVMLVLGWQGGGSIGAGELATIGASPWQLGLAVTVQVGLFSAAGVAAAAAWQWLRADPGIVAPVPGSTWQRLHGRVQVVAGGRSQAPTAADTVGDDPDETDELAG